MRMATPYTIKIRRLKRALVISWLFFFAVITLWVHKVRAETFEEMQRRIEIQDQDGRTQHVKIMQQEEIEKRKKELKEEELRRIRQQSND